jgi:antitoxin VapB
MATARVSADGQTVWLPKGFGFESDEVEVFRRGDEIVLREKPHGQRLIDAIMALPADMVRWHP